MAAVVPFETHSELTAGEQLGAHRTVYQEDATFVEQLVEDRHGDSLPAGAVSRWSTFIAVDTPGPPACGRHRGPAARTG